MTSRKRKDSLLDLCKKGTNTGNSICVRMFEYLSTSKTQPQGFRELAVEFLDICRILWSIEQGLTEASKKQKKFPDEMVDELDKKFRQTNDNFSVLNSFMTRFLDYERRGMLGKLQKGWRMMFADSDIEKLQISLRKSRDALRTSAVMFRWSLDDDKLEGSVGIGYVGLLAAIEGMSPKNEASLKSPQQEVKELEKPPLEPEKTEIPQFAPQLSPMSLSEVSSGTTFMERTEGFGIIEPRELPADNSSARRLSHARSQRSIEPRLPIMPKRRADDELSEFATDSIHQIDNRLDNITLNSGRNVHLSEQIIRLKADPSTVPRWTPRQQLTAVQSADLKVALVNAIIQKRHKTVEHLLDSGVKVEPTLEAELLKKAGSGQDLESVRLLLVFGADPNALDETRNTPLLSFTKDPFVDGAKLLIKYGADPNMSSGPDMETPLALAIRENKIEMARLYLAYGGNASQIMENGNTALIQAMDRTVSSRVVELVLQYDADPNGKNAEGKTALFEAINAKRIDLMTLLLQHGADPNLPGPKHMLWPSVSQPKALQLLLSNGANPDKAPGIMELAASMRNLESIATLLRYKVSPNVRKDGIYTPLCSAIRDDSVDIVELLLANGADPNLNASEYPAFKCVTHHRPHILPKLVAAGADLNTPKGIIEKAIAHNERECLTYLLEQGVSPNDRSEEGYTPLTTAIRDNRADLVDFLLAKGANPSVRGQEWPVTMAIKHPAILKKLLEVVPSGSLPKGALENAVVANEMESVKLLLDAGVSVEDKNGGVFSPLTSAIREQRKGLVRFLLYEAGADPNAPGEHLPIIKAIRRFREGDMEILEMLLARGAKINLMYRGWNAVLQAIENGNTKVLQLLVEKGGPVDLEARDESGRSVTELLIERGMEDSMEIIQGTRR